MLYSRDQPWWTKPVPLCTLSHCSSPRLYFLTCTWCDIHFNSQLPMSIMVAAHGQRSSASSCVIESQARFHRCISCINRFEIISASAPIFPNLVLSWLPSYFGHPRRGSGELTSRILRRAAWPNHRKRRACSSCGICLNLAASTEFNIGHPHSPTGTETVLMLGGAVSPCHPHRRLLHWCQFFHCSWTPISSEYQSTNGRKQGKFLENNDVRSATFMTLSSSYR